MVLIERVRRRRASVTRSFPKPAWLKRLGDAIRADEYRALEADTRFAVRERRHLRGAARTAMFMIIAVAGFDAIAHSAIHPALAPLIVSVNLAVALSALGALVALRGPARRHPAIVVAAVSSVVALASIGIGLRDAELEELAIGYLIMLPLVITMVVPSSPWGTALWLLGFGVVSLGFVALTPAASIDTQARTDILVILVVAIAASFTGSILRYRARARAQMQFVAIRALRQEADVQRRALSRARADLELLVRLDQLTGVWNRRRLEEDLDAARARLERGGEPFGLLELDLDRFKRVNDVSGHLVGDTVLRDVAAIFKTVSRATDVVYRFGGEEFIVLLPGADVASTRAAAERLRAAVQAAAIAHPDNAPAGVLTVSIGGTVIGPLDREATDEAWIDRADQALYRAKAGGRNRVEMSATTT